MAVKSRSRRILFARSVDVDNLNAQSRNIKNILRRWRSSAWRPTAISFREPDPDVVANPLVDIVRISPGKTWRLALWSLYQRPFQAVFCPGIHHRADYIALLSRSLSGRKVPIIATFEGLSGNKADDSREQFYSEQAGHAVYCQKLAPRHLARLEWIYRNSDHIVAISPFLARLASAKFGAKVSQLPLGIERALFGKPASPASGPLIVVCAGNVSPHKRPELFLNFAERFPDAEFRWFGDGELRESLQKRGADLGLKNLSYRGSLSPSQLAKEFARADIFVLPSRAEGVPKVSQEAAAAGLAQIVFGTFESPSVVDDMNGYVVWDDEALTARLSQLLASRELVSRMGAAGVEMAKSWDWNDVAPLWERRIQDCAEQGHSRKAKHSVLEARQQ